MPVPYNGSVARVNFGPLSAARVRRWLRNGRFDLIHIHEPITPSISLLALLAAEQPVVATFHTATPRSRSMRLASEVLGAAIEKIDAGVAVSESARNVVVQHLGRDAVVIPNGIRFDEFARRPIAESPHSSESPRLVFIGRLDEPRKGLEVLLAAVPQIRQARPNLEVIVAGQGSRPLPSWCRSLGAIDDEAKIDVLGSADIYAAPPSRESFGIVLLEAMASGLQIVASDLPSFVDLLGAPQDDGRLGEVFPVGDHRALRAQCSRFSSIPTQCGHQGRRRRAATTGRMWVEMSLPSIVRPFPQRLLDGWGAVWDEHSGDPGRDDHRRGALGLADQLAGQPSPSSNCTRGTRMVRARRRFGGTRSARRRARHEARRRPATALLVRDAAAAALEADLCRGERERAESDLSHLLDSVDPMFPTSSRELASERAQASICRRLHNDAVATALSLRRRHTVRILRLAGRTTDPCPFEMAESLCTLTAGTPDAAGRGLAGLVVQRRAYPGTGVSHDPETPPITGTAGLPAVPSPALRGVPLYDTDRVWTLSNVLSFLRLAGVPYCG